MDDFLTFINIIKIFPPNVIALNHVDVDFRKGEIHAVIGENGAGKSTLMKILYGMQSADEGEIRFHGKPIHFHNPGEAIQAGIGMVHQEIMLIPEYTIWENVILGIEPVGMFNRIDRKKAREMVAARIKEFNFNLNPDSKVEDLSVAARQKVEILKLLYRNVSILILDEPTSVLTPQEIPQLFNELRRLRDIGHTIIFISHHLDEVIELTDRITVLRKGRKINTIPTSTATKEILAQMMVGKENLFKSIKTEQPIGELVVSVSNLSFTDTNKHPKLKNIDFEIYGGEIVGIAGVEGNGQLELVKNMMGLQPIQQGTFSIHGVELTRASILEKRKLMAFVSQDRANWGASLTSSIEENAIMSHHRLNPAFTQFHGAFLNHKKGAEFTTELKNTFDIQMDSPFAEIKSLSGGNQQKVILGRELTLDTPFVLLDQPTRGLDVGSIEYVHRKILQLRCEQKAVLLISADLEELFRLSDRILVFHRGEIVANLKTAETNIDEVGLLMLEGAPTHA